MKRIDRQKFEALSETQQRAYLAKLKKLEAYKEVNPLYFQNHPTWSTKPVHEKQMAGHRLLVERPRIRQVAFFGGNQSGKTTWAVENNWIQAVDEEILPPHYKPLKKFKPPFFCRVFTPDLQDTMQVVQDKFKELCPEQQMEGGSWDKAYSTEKRIARLKNGSYFQFMSYEQELKKVGSATLHRIHFDEEPPLKFFEEGLPRLMRHGGDMIFSMTPLEGLSWAYEKLWLASGGNDNLEEWEFVNEDNGKACIVVDMDDNPYLNEQNKKDTLDEYDLSTRKARKEGRFVHFAGLIYSEWREELHVAHPFEFGYDNDKPFKDRNANIILGIDPGMRYTGLVWTAVDETNRLFAFDEALLEGWKIKEVCEYIKRTNHYHGIEPIMNVIDPQARARNPQTGLNDRTVFAENGVYTILGQKEWHTGVDQVKQRLVDNMLIVFSNCNGLRKEFPMYRYKDKIGNKNEEDVKPAPIEKDDHRLDALRYAVMSRPYLPAEVVVDPRTEIQKWMDEDKDKVANSSGVSEFGGGIYL